MLQSYRQVHNCCVHITETLLVVFTSQQTALACCSGSCGSGHTDRRLNYIAHCPRILKWRFFLIPEKFYLICDVITNCSKGCYFLSWLDKPTDAHFFLEIWVFAPDSRHRVLPQMPKDNWKLGEPASHVKISVVAICCRARQTVHCFMTHPTYTQTSIIIITIPTGRSAFIQPAHSKQMPQIAQIGNFEMFAETEMHENPSNEPEKQTRRAK